jgi:hypothetical protein
MARLNVIFVSALLHVDGLDLPAILESASSRNRSNSLRSMLLFTAGNLMQAIDGEAAEARYELQQIFSNPCYRDSVVLNEEIVDGPSLSCNSLGALHLPPAVITQIPPSVAVFNLTENAVAQRVRLSIARNLLKQFACDYS